MSHTDRQTDRGRGRDECYVLRIRRWYRTTKGQRWRASESKILRHVRPEKENVSWEWRKISKGKVIEYRRARRVGHV